MNLYMTVSQLISDDISVLIKATKTPKTMSFLTSKWVQAVVASTLASTLHFIHRAPETALCSLCNL